MYFSTYDHYSRGTGGGGGGEDGPPSLEKAEIG